MHMANANIRQMLPVYLMHVCLHVYLIVAYVHKLMPRGPLPQDPQRRRKIKATVNSLSDAVEFAVKSNKAKRAKD